MEITVPVPTFSRRVSVPVPSLSRKQLMFMGGAAVLGVVDVLSAPVAAVLASAPLLQKGVRRIAGSADAASPNGATRRSPARRASTSRSSASARAGGSSAPRASGSSGGRGTRRTASRSTRRRTRATAPASVARPQ